MHVNINNKHDKYIVLLTAFTYFVDKYFFNNYFLKYIGFLASHEPVYIFFIPEFLMVRKNVWIYFLSVDQSGSYVHCTVDIINIDR